MKAYVATKNADKLRELRTLFAGSDLELAVYPDYAEVEETADDYTANALSKARGLRSQLAQNGDVTAVLADDSGIEVAALGGRPGVLSARYAGDVSWSERRGQMLAEVDGVPKEQRGARFVCAIVLIEPDGRELAGRGEVEGFIAQREAGSNGFGYDAIFYFPALGKTFAELSEEEKNRLSHRYHAAQALLAALRAR